MPLYLVKKVWIWTCRNGCSQHNLKKMLRSALTLAIMLIFIVCPPVAKVVGEFDTFAASLAMAFPCFLPFSLHIYVLITLLLMLLVSWAWICIATAAGFAARSASSFTDQLQTSMIPDVSANEMTPSSVISGQYLDTRCSLVFGIVLLLSAFGLGLGIAHKRRLMLQLYFSLFIISMVFFANTLAPVPLYGGLQGTLRAVAIYAAVSSATYIVVFPESFSHAWMKKAQHDIFLPIIASLGRNTSFQRDEVIAQLDAMLDLYRAERVMSALEFSVSRLSPLEFSDLFELVHKIVGRVKYLYFSQGPACRVEVAELKYDESLRTLQDFADDVQNYCRFSLISIHDWFYSTTKHSWKSVFTGTNHDKVAFTLQGLETARDDLKNACKAFQSHASQFHDTAQNLTPSGGMTVIFSSLDNLDLLAADILSLLEFLISIERRQPPFRFWSPRVLSNLRRQSPATPTAGPPANRPVSLSSFSILAGRRVDSTRVIKWMGDPRTIFAFRMALVSAGLFALGVCKATVGVYAQHGGVMAMVLAQSYLTIYAGDQIRFWVVRMTATLLGLLVSALAWFISAGEGTGNPYLLVTSITILALPTMLVSVSSWKATRMLFGIVFSTTMILTLTTVWNKAQGEHLSRSDVLAIVGERAVVDILAFAASILVTLLPMGPITARRGFHDLLADSVDAAHAEIVRSISTSTPKCATSVSTVSKSSKNHLPNRRPGSTSISKGDTSVSIDGLQHHQSMRSLLMSMNFEPRVTNLPKAAYRQIFEAHARLLASITLYSGALQRLNIHPQQRKHLESRIPGLNAAMVDKVLHGIEHLVRSARRRYHDVGPEFIPALVPVRPGLVRSPRILVRLKRLYSVLDRTDPWQHPEEGAVPPADAVYESTTMPTLQDHIEFFHSYAQLQLGIGLGIKYAPLGSGDVLALATVVWHFSSIVKEVDTMNRLLDNMD